MPLPKPTRRNFLKMLALGSGALLVAPILKNFSFGDTRNVTSVKKNAKSELRLAETSHEFILYNNNGEELISIDKDA